MKEVTAAIILMDNRVLITQRAQGENLAGKWEFPGGKLELGETPQECLKREIREELDVEIEVSGFFGESIYAYHSGTIKLMAFWCKWIRLSLLRFRLSTLPESCAKFIAIFLIPHLLILMPVF